MWSSSGRTIHAFHTGGAGGGHALDIIKIAGLKNVLPSSTNPTRPFTRNTIDEHLDMLMVCHHLDPRLRKIWRSSRKPHPQGNHRRRRHLARSCALSMMSSDSQAMAGSARSSSAPADRRQDEEAARLVAGGQGDNDNFRVKRYIAKYTINPARLLTACSKLIARWRRENSPTSCWSLAFFGVKPDRTVMAARSWRAPMGDPNAFIPTPQPVHYQPISGLWQAADGVLGGVHVQGRGHRWLRQEALYRQRSSDAVQNTRDKISKKSTIHNGVTPRIEVTETYEVRADGELLTCALAEKACPWRSDTHVPRSRPANKARTKVPEDLRFTSLLR